MAFLAAALIGLASCNFGRDDRATYIASANVAVNYPVVAMIVPGDQETGAIAFTNLASGTRFRLSTPGTSYNGVQRAAASGQFVVTFRKGDRYFLGTFDLRSRSVEVVGSSDRLSIPMFIGESPCAGRPTTITDKGQYDYFIECFSDHAVSETSIPIVNYAYSAGREVTFLGLESGKNVAYSISLIDDKITLSSRPIPMRFRPYAFYHGEEFYVFDRVEPHKVYIHRKQGFEEFDGKVADRVRKANLGGTDEIWFVDDSVLVTTSIDFSAGTFLVTIASEGSSRELEIDIYEN
ncbi:MAG TPA: hypothetical protein VMF90_25045 [Rhizobiaceae bacterium]|nr:hypothetical protein [Rhizobiaceae bacterium]